MADNEHTRRARELLKSGTELLERSRNRPHVEVGSWRSERFEQGATQVVHEPRAKPHRRAAMDPESSKSWNAWAEGIARKQACKIGSEVLELSDKAFKVLVDRLDHLEAEVGRLKGQQPDREEWPLRAIKGGKR